MRAALASLLIVGAALTGFSSADAQTHRNLQQEERNRQLVLRLFHTSDPQAMIGLMADDYKQHNPTIRDGKAGATEFFTEMFKKYPNSTVKVVHVAADGDLVWVHGHMIRYPNDPGVALVDIFRVKNGKLVEHWDIMQPVPETSANSNSMF